MQRSFHVQMALLFFLNSAVLLLAEEPTKLPPLPAGKTCQGTLVLGDKTYKLDHAVAYPTKTFDEDSVSVIVSPKPIPVDKLKAAIAKGKGSDDSFMFWEPHIKLTYKTSGEIQFCNAWASNNSLSVSGSDLTGRVVIQKDRAGGDAILKQDADSDRKRSFSLQFNTPLLPNALPKAAPKVAKAEDEDTNDDSEEKSATSAGPKPKVRSLPRPTDATDIEYKDLVEQMTYKSKSDVKSLSAFLVKQLAAQGWKADGTDLITPKSAILRRKQGGAELTIFVKPATAGSQITIMSEGLSWEEGE
jgi:hypothetical protein